MADKISILNSKYYRAFDNTDSCCWWQVDQVTDDIDSILDSHQIDYETLSDDWGISYYWVDRNQLEYSMNISCVDSEIVRFEIEYWATKRKWGGLRRTIVDTTDDFGRLIPAFLELNEKTENRRHSTNNQSAP